MQWRLKWAASQKFHYIQLISFPSNALQCTLHFTTNGDTIIHFITAMYLCVLWDYSLRHKIVFSEYPTYKLFWVGWTILGTILGTIVGQLDIHVSKGPLLCTTCTTASPMKWTVALGSKMDYSGGQVDLPKPLWTKSDEEVATNFIFPQALYG